MVFADIRSLISYYLALLPHQAKRRWRCDFPHPQSLHLQPQKAKHLSWRMMIVPWHSHTHFRNKMLFQTWVHSESLRTAPALSAPVFNSGLFWWNDPRYTRWQILAYPDLPVAPITLLLRLKRFNTSWHLILTYAHFILLYSKIHICFCENSDFHFYCKI